MYAAFQWQQTFCKNAQFFVKVDDDVVVDLPRLQYWIEKKISPLQKQWPVVTFGNFRKPEPPVRRQTHKK